MRAAKAATGHSLILSRTEHDGFRLQKASRRDENLSRPHYSPHLSLSIFFFFVFSSLIFLHSSNQTAWKSNMSGSVFIGVCRVSRCHWPSRVVSVSSLSILLLDSRSDLYQACAAVWLMWFASSSHSRFCLSMHRQASSASVSDIVFFWWDTPFFFFFY